MRCWATSARDLVRELQDLPVDWWIREQPQALVRTKVKRLLVRYGYPPDASPQAVELVLRQTRTYAEDTDMTANKMIAWEWLTEGSPLAV
ncbi:type I restriction enzyme endonuclease domain-containing protein [Dactylosporangium sp. NPDC051484]|uniref:type I restriction enzyme endonuclease domain-containing protein n=1 Tax=Dactylosporangium sp. NPDC051484 TaxID=3154942 RepID=UPI0034509901